MVRIPVIVEPVDVPVPLAIVPVEVQHVTVAVRVAQKCIACHPFHCPLIILGAVCGGSTVFGIIMP